MQKRVTISVDDSTVKSIEALRKNEKRSFSSMANILLGEAIVKRVIPILDKRFSKQTKGGGGVNG